jgi:hypothetical protein
MARERQGFIVSKVWAVVHYTDASGQHHKIIKAAKAQSADSHKNLTDAEKQKLKIRDARQLLRDTIDELKQRGAKSCIRVNYVER